jgi:hypothetical protein
MEMEIEEDAQAQDMRNRFMKKISHVVENKQDEFLKYKIPLNISENTYAYLFNLVEQFQNDNELELEIRFGTNKNDKYNASVSEDRFNSILNKLKRNHKWTNVNGYFRECDIFYYLTREMRQKNQQIRTTTRYEWNDEMKSLMSQQEFVPPEPNILEWASKTHISVTHMIKSNIEKNTFNLQSDGSEDAYRFSLSREVEFTSTETLPIIISQIQFCRIKRRISFTYKDIIRLDLTKSWSGSTKQIAEQKENEEDPTYEIEMELIHSDQTNIQYLTLSLCCLLCDHFPLGIQYDEIESYDIL